MLWLTPAAEEMKEADWNFPEGRFLAYVLGPLRTGRRADLHRAQRRTEEIAFKLPKCPNTSTWQQVLNTADVKQNSADFASGSDTKAPPRSVLAFAGSA